MVVGVVAGVVVGVVWSGAVVGTFPLRAFVKTRRKEGVDLSRFEGLRMKEGWNPRRNHVWFGSREQTNE